MLKKQKADEERQKALAATCPPAASQSEANIPKKVEQSLHSSTQQQQRQHKLKQTSPKPKSAKTN